ncbi:MAG: chaperonin GroEL [Anaerolineales bacterium]
MSKLILTHEWAQTALNRGALILSKAISPTMGPIGRTVLMSHRGSKPKFVSDGFTITRQLELLDPFEDMAIRFLEEASERVREACGDGTSTTVILAEAILRAAQPSLAMGADAMAMAQGMRVCVEPAVRALQDLSTPIANEEELGAIGAVASKDKEIGAKVANLVFQLGPDGAVIALPSKGREFSAELIEGFHFDHGALSPYFITDRTKMEAVLENPYILLTGSTLEFVDDILPALEKILPTARRLVILAEDVKGEALAGLAMNQERGNLEVLAVKAPDAGGRQEERLKDLAAAIGATVLPDDHTGRTLADINLEDLGQVERVVSDRSSTTIYGLRGDEETISRRVRIIQGEIEDAQTDQYARYLTERIGAIQGQTGYLHIGGITEAEAEERLPRVRNAVAACKEALRTGWVPGGGVALVSAAGALESINLEGDELIGLRALQSAMVFPFLTIVHNSGAEPSLYLDRLADAGDDATIDAVTGEITSARESGIMDATGAVEAVLRRSVSVAMSLLTVDVAIADVPVAGPMGDRLDMGAKYE